MACEPSIDSHTDLEIQSSDLNNIDNTLGSVGFLAQGMDYLQTKHLYNSLHFYNSTTWHLFCD